MAGHIFDPNPGPDATIAELVRRIEKLSKINAALMQRVERSMEQQANAYSLFQTAIGLEAQVRMRTEELKAALTRLEQTNEELTQARDASEQANRFKTRFFTAVGHDLLQPLHAARLSLSALAEEPGPTGHLRIVEQIDHALSSVDELLRSILDISKLEAGVIKPDLRDIRVDDLLQSLASDLSPLARSKNLALTCRSNRYIARSDPLMLRRILQNLAANAVRYTQHGEVKLAARRRGSEVQIEVWDTGPGIPDSERQRIFEEFHRGAASERSGQAGFGLGLSIVKRTSQTLGHHVDICSRVGRGTRFSVLVPFVGMVPVGSIAGNPAQQSEVPPYGFAGSRVVVIDNDASVLEAMQALLTRWSCDVLASADLAGVEAMVRSSTAPPAIVLADYHLDNGERGLTAIELLRRSHGSLIPAIVITADHAAEIADEVRLAGCELLRKPVKPAELRALLQHYLG